MKFPQFLLADDERTFQVIGEITKNDDEASGIFVDGKGYIDEDGYIWIHSGSGKPKNANQLPYFWFENGKKKFSEPNKKVFDVYNASKLKDMSIGIIVDNTKEGEELYSEQAINDMNSAAEVYVPTYKDTDDFLKKLIKTAIVEKGVDIARLKYKMPEKYILPNMKAALNGDTKMSVLYFITWAELLGLDFMVVLNDNGSDPIDPLKQSLIYDSTKDRVLRESEMK